MVMKKWAVSKHKTDTESVPLSLLIRQNRGQAFLGIYFTE